MPEPPILVQLRDFFLYSSNITFLFLVGKIKKFNQHS